MFNVRNMVGEIRDSMETVSPFLISVVRLTPSSDLPCPQITGMQWQWVGKRWMLQKAVLQTMIALHECEEPPPSDYRSIQ